jgi:hypothetical protein
MSRGTTLRNVRISDELWAAVLEKADAEGRTASQVIRDLLTEWLTLEPAH